MLAYGKGAIKKNGLYDKVVSILTVLLGGYKVLTAEEVLEILKTAYAAVSSDY